MAREAELETVAGLIDRVEDGPRVLLLEGEAGIGKSTLWRWGVDRAHGRGDVVLACRPGETESALPFAALEDVLGSALDEVLPALPSPQRAALETALARIEPTETLGRLAVARATLSVVKEIASKGPLILAIDDAQWLDPSSAEVLEFVVRRVEPLPVKVLLTRRGDTLPVPLGIDRAVRAESFIRMWLAPLSIGELDGLLRSRIGLVLQRPRLVELHRITGGNPFYALEIARAADRRGLVSTGDFTVPDSLSGLLGDRLAALSSEGRDAILLAAATLQPAVALVEKAAGGNAGLTEAVGEGMLELSGDRLVFAHPLLASVTYDSAPLWERREAHGRLARASGDRLERARHLALATEDADEAIAAELDAAALRAHRLGATTAAAELAEHARRLTPQDDERALLDRTTRSAEYLLAEGDSVGGRALLEEVVAGLSPGPERAVHLLRLGHVRFLGDEIAAAEEMFRQVLEETGKDTRLEAEAQQALAFTAMFGGDIPGALTYARSALELAEGLDDERLLALSLARLVLIEFLLGMGFDRARMDEAIRLEPHIGEAPVEWLPSYALAGISQFADELDTARNGFAALHAAASEQGDERALATVLFSLSQVECASGNWGLANRYADEAIERSRQSGLAAPQANALGVKTQVSALMGHVDEARAAAEEGLEITSRTGAVAPLTWLIAALGFLELSLGDAEAANARLGPLAQMIVAIGLGEPGVVRFIPDEIEALVALGEMEQARVLTAMLEERGHALDRPWALATGARSAALVAAAEGDFGSARDSIIRARAAGERLEQPFELGRTLLVEGTIERRAKRRGVARRALADALEVFDALGAPLWAEKAAAELARIPGREPAPGTLTATERRVAELVASGLSNKEVAAQLFVTVRTVEWNLSKVYAKLGVRSRTELAARLQAEAGA